VVLTTKRGKADYLTGNATFPIHDGAQRLT
jgi:hypothetical protein